MTTDPMTEAVEAAARAMIRMRWPDSEPITPEDRRVARAAITTALPILRAQFAEEVAGAWDNDKSLYALIEDRMLASEGRDADAVQDIGTEWLRNYTGGTK